MSDHTTLGYMGDAFENKTLWQLLVNSEFAENVLPHIESKYFENQNYKQLSILIKEYFERYEKSPDLKNHSIHETIKSSNLSDIDKETLIRVVEKIENYEKAINKGFRVYDGDVVKERVWRFIKSQELRRLADLIYITTAKGELDKSIDIIGDKIKEIDRIGPNQDEFEDVFDDVEATFVPEYREAITTGIEVLNSSMGGGLGKGEVGIILAPLGVGKTSILTFFANAAHAAGKNVLQIFFEDTYKEIRRKHACIWSGVPLPKFNDNLNEIKEIVRNKKKTAGGRLMLLRLKQEGVTMPKIQREIIRFQKEKGIKFDEIILDYLDTQNIESHKTGGDDMKDEIVIMKAFMRMVDEFQIPGWTAIQSNREGLDAEIVKTSHMGGTIKKAQKTHFLMSASHEDENQQDKGKANVKILKARFAKSGTVFKDSIWDVSKMKFQLIQGNPNATKVGQHHDEEDIDDINEKMKASVVDKKKLEEAEEKLSESYSPEIMQERLADV